MKWKKKAPLIGALVVASILGLAAFGKLLFPREDMRSLEFAAGIFEICALVVLFLTYHKWWIWFALALVFAAWSGYAFYWVREQQPCGCLGALIEFSPNISFFVDNILWGGCLVMSAYLGCRLKYIALGIMGSVLLGILGYAYMIGTGA